MRIGKASISILPENAELENTFKPFTLKTSITIFLIIAPGKFAQSSSSESAPTASPSPAAIGYNSFTGLSEPGFSGNGRTFFIKASYLLRKSF